MLPVHGGKQPHWYLVNPSDYPRLPKYHLNWSETCWIQNKSSFKHELFYWKIKFFECIKSFNGLILSYSHAFFSDCKWFCQSLHDSSILLSDSWVNWIIIHKSRHWKLSKKITSFWIIFNENYHIENYPKRGNLFG